MKLKEINTILIANRGEIASRVIRTCKKMGIRSVAVFSEADRDSLFVVEADTAIFIGESSPTASYLDQDKIIAAAKLSKADAIHPGYGFLSENLQFCSRCEEENILFIGPNSSAIEAMGSKSKAKSLMNKHKVPVVPGYQGKAQSTVALKKEAIKVGFPLLLKATAGGGGKGMRIVQSENEFEKALDAAKREAKSSFGDDEMIVEKYIEAGRHIEFQIFGDKHGNAIHLLERECSIQRRYQKVIEESPSPVLTEKLRKKMGDAAVKAAKALNYDNAGTVEFIFDDISQDFYFLEVNTRLQVEHPVTEEITGLDLVQMQIESAQGIPLQLKQDDVKGEGYAIECRLYAEDPSNDFLPVTGTIERFEFPDVEGLRVETAIESGSEISIFYDPMIAKIIVWDRDRRSAHRKMKFVLRNLICLGMTTNQSFLLHILENEDFAEGVYTTHFIEKKIDLNAFAKLETASVQKLAIAACLFEWAERESNRTQLVSIPSGWRNSFNNYQHEKFLNGEEELLLEYRYLFKDQKFEFKIEEENYSVTLIEAYEESIRIEIDGQQFQFELAKSAPQSKSAAESIISIQNDELGMLSLEHLLRFPPKQNEGIKGGYETPMPSQIVKVLVEPGQEVKSGEGLVILSSMKMENTVEAVADGFVDEVYVEEGQNVEAGYLLLKMKESE